MGELSAGELLSLLPLGVVVVQGGRKHSVGEKPAAGAPRKTETGNINKCVSANNDWVIYKVEIAYCLL